MALGKTVTKILDNKTAAASTPTVLTDCTTVDTANVLMLGIEVTATYNAAATLGVTVKVFGSYDDTNFDVDPCDQWDLTFVANTTHSMTRAVIPAARYLKVQVLNKDAGQSATAISIWSHPLTG